MSYFPCIPPNANQHVLAAAIQFNSTNIYPITPHITPWAYIRHGRPGIFKAQKCARLFEVTSLKALDICEMTTPAHWAKIVILRTFGHRLCKKSDNQKT